MNRTIWVVSTYLPFAKSSAELREGQRGRSRRAVRSFANGNTKQWIESGRAKAMKKETDNAYLLWAVRKVESGKY